MTTKCSKLQMRVQELAESVQTLQSDWQAAQEELVSVEAKIQEAEKQLQDELEPKRDEAEKELQRMQDERTEASRKLQSWLVIGHDLPRVPLEDQAALEVMDYILGEYHMRTRLMVNTRYKYGYTNDASSFREDRWYGPGGYYSHRYNRYRARHHRAAHYRHRNNIY